jgi:hypothetical protein
MARVQGGIQLLLLLAAVVACVPGTAIAGGCASPVSDQGVPPALSDVQQIPNLLREIVEALKRAIKQLEDSLRDQLCSGCPASTGTLILASLLAIGHDLMRRR